MTTNEMVIDTCSFFVLIELPIAIAADTPQIEPPAPSVAANLLSRPNHLVAVKYIMRKVATAMMVAWRKATGPAFTTIVKGRVAPIRTIPVLTYSSVRKAASNQTGIFTRFPMKRPKTSAAKGASIPYWPAHFQALNILIRTLKTNSKRNPAIKWVTFTP